MPCLAHIWGITRNIPLTPRILLSILALIQPAHLSGGHLSKIPIYTIGYGNRSIEDFVKVLQQYGIKFLVDIRSKPYSQFHPEFSRETLEKSLKQYGMQYLFMGDTLGGFPKDSACYVNGKIDYAKVREQAFFQKGIGYLRTAWEKQLRIVLMCSEAKPQECHRSKLIGNTLIEQDIDVAHIDETGAIKTQSQIDQMLTGGQLSLFSQDASMPVNKKTGLSRKKHISRSEST